jgi:hypothetical protein
VLVLLILPLWLLGFLAGALMVPFRRSRHRVIYAVVMSATALVVSYALSYAALFAGTEVAVHQPDPFRFLVLAAYFIALPLGAFLGALAGFAMTRKVLGTASARVLSAGAGGRAPSDPRL